MLFVHIPTDPLALSEAPLSDTLDRESVCKETCQSKVVCAHECYLEIKCVPSPPQSVELGSVNWGVFLIEPNPDSFVFCNNGVFEAPPGVIVGDSS